jgi:hypothetical protein
MSEYRFDILTAKLLIVVILWVVSFVSTAQEYGTIAGYSGTVKGPIGLTYGGLMGKSTLMMWIRLTPMSLEKLTGVNVDKDYSIEDNEIVADLDSDKFLIPTGNSYIRRFSMGYMYGRKLGKRIYWYAGLGYGIFQKHVEHDMFHIGSYSDTYGVVDKDNSARGLETEAGFMVTVAEGLMLSAGLTTVNFAFEKVGVDPSFGLLFILYNKNTRVRNLNKYRIR